VQQARQQRHQIRSVDREVLLLQSRHCPLS
jgi:hypothetical protein